MVAVDSISERLLEQLQTQISLSRESFEFFMEHPCEVPQALSSAFRYSYPAFREAESLQTALQGLSDLHVAGLVSTLLRLESSDFNQRRLAEVFREEVITGAEAGTWPNLPGFDAEIREMLQRLEDLEQGVNYRILRQCVASGLEIWVTSLQRHKIPEESTNPEGNPSTSRPALPEALQALIRQRSSERMLSVSQAAAALNVSRQTVYDWIEAKRLLGWPKGTVRGYWVPAEQIVAEGRVVPGLAQVVEVIGDPELAWSFLDQPWAVGDEFGRPIEILRDRGEAAVDHIVGAARGFSEGAFL